MGRVWVVVIRAVLPMRMRNKVRVGVLVVQGSWIWTQMYLSTYEVGR